MMTGQSFQVVFSSLFQLMGQGRVPYAVQFDIHNSPPPLELIAHVNIVPFIDDKCLVIYLNGDGWDIPGGTLEPDETYLEAIKRELMEEAGARLLNFNILGAWLCHSPNAKPYRPHLPHPDFYRMVGYGEVEMVGNPLIPDGGEQVERVELTSVEQAVENFLQQDRSDLAELYQLAAMVRKNQVETP